MTMHSSRVREAEVLFAWGAHVSLGDFHLALAGTGAAARLVAEIYWQQPSFVYQVGALMIIGQFVQATIRTV